MGRNMIQWASGIAGRCAVCPKQRNSAPPNGEGTEKMSEQNRRLRAAGIAALAWAGLAAVWCVLVPGGAAELPQGVPGTLRSLLVRLAVQLRDAGKTAGQIAATLEHAKEHLHLVAVIDDLKYLRKGGRLPAAVAVAGGMLGIKPLITIKEGKVVMAGKARGLPGAYVALFKKIEELGGISTCFDALAGYTLAPREVQPIQTYLQENLGRNEALVRQIGCVIGTHAGPGAFGLAFLDEGFTF